MRTTIVCSAEIAIAETSHSDAPAPAYRNLSSCGFGCAGFVARTSRASPAGRAGQSESARLDGGRELSVGDDGKIRRHRVPTTLPARTREGP
jgi:hypothetical protein